MAGDVFGQGWARGNPLVDQRGTQIWQKGASARFLPSEWLGATVEIFNLSFRAGALFLHHYIYIFLCSSALQLHMHCRICVIGTRTCFRRFMVMP
jgi:hypothetical protein